MEDPGLAEPPSRQLVFLHPDVALEYVHAADDGDQFKPALMVEFVGADFWSWNEKGEQEGPWGLPIALGAGFVGTFSDRAGSNDWGWGGVDRVNHNYNFGLTSHGVILASFSVPISASFLLKHLINKKPGLG